MPTATLSVTHDNDLASLGWRELTSEWYFIVHPADLDIGHITLDTYKQGHCLRFRNFPIPPGSKILYAYLKYHSWSDYDVDVVRCYIKAEKALNPQPFTTWADYSGRTRTDEKQDWSEIPHWKLNRRYNSIDFAAVVKEVIDQPGWAAGNPFVIFCDDLDDRSDHLFGCTRHAHARWEWPERAPQLHLSWIQPYEEPPPIQPGESYTITGTAFFKLLENYQNGQTFTPQTEHILDYIDIDLKTGPITAKVTIDIYEAGLDHKPVGDPLSSSTTTVHSILPGTVKRVRFTMHSRPPLSPDSEYIFAIYHKPILLGSRAEVLYDHFDSTYPRGHRLVSLDAGETWTLKLDQDTIFTEFGHPPLPKPLPPPPH